MFYCHLSSEDEGQKSSCRDLPSHLSNIALRAKVTTNTRQVVVKKRNTSCYQSEIEERVLTCNLSRHGRKQRLHAEHAPWHIQEKTRERQKEARKCTNNDSTGK